MDAILELERAIEKARQKGYHVAAVISDYSERHDVWHKPIIAIGDVKGINSDHILLDMIHMLTNYWDGIEHNRLPSTENS